MFILKYNTEVKKVNWEVPVSVSNRLWWKGGPGGNLAELFDGGYFTDSQEVIIMGTMADGIQEVLGGYDGLFGGVGRDGKLTEDFFVVVKDGAEGVGGGESHGDVSFF